MMERFWSKVDKSGDCWLWRAAVASGYGTFRGPDGHMIGAHRMSYLLSHGEIPEGLQVLHTCDNKLCVRPDHLFLGTQQDNMDDMIQKGRQALGDQLNHRAQVGEQNHNAGLSGCIVDRVRRLHRDGYRQCEIARLVGATKANVWAIVHNKSWCHAA